MRFLCAILPLLVALLISTAPARASTGLVEQVAGCTGRLSAYLEEQWSVRDPRAERTAALHGHMTDLMFAVLQPETDRAGRALRAEAKRSFRALLKRARGTRYAPRLSVMAQTKATRDLRACVSLIQPRDQVDAALGFDQSPDLFVNKRETEDPTPWTELGK